MGVELVCPSDAEPLRRVEPGGAYACPACHARYPVEGGVVRFLGGADAFYEGRFLHTIPYLPRSERAPFAWPLWLMHAGYVWAVRRSVPAGRTLLEVGCAGGIAYFARRYRVIGLDLSASSLSRVAALYDACLQADLTAAFPLPPASVDAVASSFLWEHIPPERKPRMLEQCARVLRPGGRLVFLFDVECESPLYRHLKRLDPARYREVLIEREGHLGWQLPGENRRLFEQSGFRVLEYRGKDKLLVAPAIYEKIAEWGGATGALAARLRRLTLRRGPFHAYNALERVCDETLGRLLPESWSRVIVAVCEKRP